MDHQVVEARQAVGIREVVDHREVVDTMEAMDHQEVARQAVVAVEVHRQHQEWVWFPTPRPFP
jgi:hypothetical protein